MTKLRNKNLAILTGEAACVVVLSPAAGVDYKKTLAGRAQALDDFFNEKPFILGLSDPRKAATQATVVRAQILKVMRARGFDHATVIIFNHSKSEVLRATMECTKGNK